MQQGQNGIHQLPWMMWSPLFWFGGQWGATDKDKPTSTASKATPSMMASETATNFGSGVMKAGAQASSEVIGLMTRRSQAMISFAAEAAKCRAPQDLIGLQMKYWQTAVEQHTEATRRIAAAWSITLPQLPAGAFGTAVAPVRDRITLSEPDNSAVTVTVPTQSGRSSQGDRRSAA